MCTGRRAPHRCKGGLALALVLLVTAARAQEIQRGAVDPAVRFSDGSVSLLVSQLGYGSPGVRQAFLMAASRTDGDAIASYTVEDASGTVVHTGTPVYAGAWQTVYFWRLDLAPVRVP